MGYKSGKINTPVPILAKELNIESLERRRFNIDTQFMYNLLNNKIDCSELLSKISFNVPNHNLRTTNTFYVQPFKQNYSLHSPLNRIMYNCNSLENFDFFFDSQNNL